MTTTHPTPPDQGDERRALQGVYLALADLHCECSFKRREEGKHLPTCHLFDLTLAIDTLAALSATQPVAQEADVLLRVIQRLNSNPYSLTKQECISEVDAMRDAALAAPHPSQGAADSIEPKDDVYTAVLSLDTFRPVRLEFGVTMHRDVIPNDAGWIRREDVLSALAAPHSPVSAEAGKGATVVVPWEPTTAMVNAGQCGCMDNDVAVSIYKAMLAVAPSESVAVSGEVSDVAIDSAISTVWEDWEDDIDRRRELARAVLALAGSARQASALERMARLDDEMGIEP